MNLFKKTEGAVKNRVARSRFMYSTAIIAVILVVIIALNVLFSVAGDRLHLSWDLSANQSFSISEGNINYIKSVDAEVNIIVCATEEDYTGDYLAQYAAYYYSAEDTTGKYFSQTVQLIKKYAEYNDNISVEFVDVQSNEFTAIQQAYPNADFAYGDILVEGIFENSEGKTINRHKIITFGEIYELTDESGMVDYGYGSYTISGNNIETMLSSAIYYATSEDTVKAAYFTSHSQSEFLTQHFIPSLKLNNYECTPIDDVIITESSIPEDTDVLLLSCVTADFTTAELDVIESFLLNGRERGKGLVYFASTSSPNLPNFYAFLEEWGISVGQGVLYETTADFTSQVQTNMIVANNATDFTKEVNSKQGGYIVGNIVPIERTFERYGDRKTDRLMSTSDTVVVAPVGINAETWKPDDSYTKAVRDVAVISYDTKYDNNAEGVSSYIIAFGSTDFVYSDLVTNANVLNLDMAVCAANIASGNSDSPISFGAKSIDDESFAEKVTMSSVATMRFVFIILVPVAILAACLVVYLRRRSR